MWHNKCSYWIIIFFTTYWYFSKNVRSADGSIKTDGCSKARHRNPKKVEERIWYPPSSYKLFLQYLSRWCINKWYTVASYYSLLSCDLDCCSILSCIASFRFTLYTLHMIQYTVIYYSTPNHMITSCSMKLQYITYLYFTWINTGERADRRRAGIISSPPLF